MSCMQKITPFLWFDGQAEEAAKFYVSVFKNSKITGVTHYSDELPERKGVVMTVGFELNGQKFTALNGGPMFKFNESISFVVNCETQEEIDYYWNKLSSDGGQEVQCGWVKDKFGLCWQVVPCVFWKWTEEGDAAAMGRVMHELMQMRKLDLAMLQRAHDAR